jgi:hypothetical protein
VRVGRIEIEVASEYRRQKYVTKSQSHSEGGNLMHQPSLPCTLTSSHHYSPLHLLLDQETATHPTDIAIVIIITACL